MPPISWPARSKWRARSSSPSRLHPEPSGRGRGRKLGGGHRSRRSAGARRHAVPPGAPDRRTLVLESVRTGKKPADWTAEDMQRFAPEFTADIAALLDPAEGMRSREIAGGTGPEAVAAALAAPQERLGEE